METLPGTHGSACARAGTPVSAHIALTTAARCAMALLAPTRGRWFWRVMNAPGGKSRLGRCGLCCRLLEGLDKQNSRRHRGIVQTAAPELRLHLSLTRIT